METSTSLGVNKFLENERLRLIRELEEAQENYRVIGKLYEINLKESEDLRGTNQSLTQEIEQIKQGQQREYQRNAKERKELLDDKNQLLDDKNRYEKFCRELQQRFSNQNKVLQESQKKVNDQEMTLLKLRQKCDNQGTSLRELQQRYDGQIKNFRELQQRYDGQMKNFRESQELQLNLNKQNKALQELQQKYDNKVLESERQCQEFEQQLNDRNSKLSSLKQWNAELKEEAAGYQSALGEAKNLKMGDDDKNHNVQLNKDIISLQDMIGDYVTNLGKNKVNVKVDRVAKLLPSYDCQTKIDGKNPDKLFVKAVLQRYVLDMILGYAKNYFDVMKPSKSRDIDHLESDITRRTDELCETMETFANVRDGTDEITKVTPIKLRQLVYTALGMRGVGNTRNLIKAYTTQLNHAMNQFRVVTDLKKREQVNGMAEVLIREVFRIFYFRLKVQEPIAQYHWYKSGDNVDRISMKVSCEDEEIDDLVVDLCTFPLVGQNMNSNQKIFTPAKVFTCHKSVYNSRLSLVSKAKNTIKYLYYGESNNNLNSSGYFNHTNSSNSSNSNESNVRDLFTNGGRSNVNEKREDSGDKRISDGFNHKKTSTD